MVCDGNTQLHLPRLCTVSLGVINGFSWLGRECEVIEKVPECHQGNGAELIAARVLQHILELPHAVRHQLGVEMHRV